MLQMLRCSINLLRLAESRPSFSESSGGDQTVAIFGPNSLQIKFEVVNSESNENEEVAELPETSEEENVKNLRMRVRFVPPD